MRRAGSNVPGMASGRTATRPRYWLRSAPGDLLWEVSMPVALPAHVQMALDEVLLHSLIAGRRTPTLRFWEWSEPALILGSNQVLANEVDVDRAHELGFVVARRMSGGGTMIVEPGRTVTYSLYAPQSLVSGLSLVESFAFFDAWVVDCLRKLGVPADYRPINDIVSPLGKIGGAAPGQRAPPHGDRIRDGYRAGAPADPDRSGAGLRARRAQRGEGCLAAGSLADAWPG